MRTKGQKPDYVELNNSPIVGLYSNKDLEDQVRYYYYYKDNKRISATSDLPTALQRFFSSTPKPEQKLNQLALSDCLTKYLTQRRDKELSYYYTKELIRFFNQFIAITGCEFVHQVSFQIIQKYNDQVYKLSRQVDKRPDLFINKRFASVRTVFRAIVKKEEQKDDLNKLIDNLKVLDFAKKKRTQAVAITKEQFQELYKKSEGQPIQRLLLLLGLNCGYMPERIV